MNAMLEKRIAAGAALVYLCAGGRDLGVPATQLAAVLAYNPSAEYARTVLAWSSAYGSGAPVDLSLPIDAASNKVTVTSAGDLEVTAKGALTLGGRTVEITAQQKLTATGHQGAELSTQGGLTVRGSYFDPLPYLELSETGEAIYVEHHRTLGERVREIVAAEA